MQILLHGLVNDLVLLFALLGVPGTSIVSQGGGIPDLTPTGFRQHLGGLPEPHLLRGY